MATIRQTSFLAGELAPHLWGRTDHKLYAHGLRQCLNFIPLPQGPVTTRPGSRLVAAAVGSRLIPYIYSDTVSFVLEFGNNVLRFYTNGEQEMSGGSPLQLATPWATADLPQLQFAQLGSVLTLTHPSYAPRDLTRSSGGVWSLVASSFDPPDTAATYGIDPGFVNSSLPASLVDSPAGYPFTGDSYHPLSFWTWFYSEIGWDANGNPYETRPLRVESYNDGVTFSGSPLATPANLNLAKDHPLTIRRLIDSIHSPTHLRVKGYAWYRGRGSLFGFVGMGMERDFVDYGQEPDYTRQPRVYRWGTNYRTNPFYTEKTAGPTYTYSYPAACGYFENRRLFGGSAAKPGTIWTSAFSDFTNFDEYPLAWPGMPLVFELATHRRESIRAIASGQKIFLFTDSAVWTMEGGAQGPLDYDTVMAKSVDDVGIISTVRPLMVNGSVFWVRSKGVGVRQLAPSWTGSAVTYQGSDASQHAIHLFQVGAEGYRSNWESQTILDWTYAEDPYGIIWAVRGDGTLLTATPSGSSLAWARHTSGQGAHNDSYLAVCSVPEGAEDAVYVIVKRTISLTDRYYVERFESTVQLRRPIDQGYQYDPCGLDSYKMYNIIAPVGGIVDAGYVITGMDHLEGEYVYIVVPVVDFDLVPTGVEIQGPIQVSLGQVTTTAPMSHNFHKSPAAYVRCYIGMPFTCDLETLDVPTSEKARMKTVTRVGFEVESSRGLWVGQDFDHLVEWRQRQVVDGYGSPADLTDFVAVNVPGKWAESARAALRRVDPFPVTVLGITREVDGGG